MENIGADNTDSSGIFFFETAKERFLLCIFNVTTPTRYRNVTVFEQRKAVSFWYCNESSTIIFVKGRTQQGDKFRLREMQRH